MKTFPTKKRKLNYRFHNPNPTAATADYILKVLIEANQEKAQTAIREAANVFPNTDKSEHEHSA